ncbi:hypothetical protein [Rhodococcus sp. USK13]|uniref:hypothetical protein n=1 Tax=Rhodococcus sp. USK13 TaxID=2806442 RepID=UPI001BCBB1AC|nr:hypothetical protein [Rhodococcus sp. USK13]
MTTQAQGTSLRTIATFAPTAAVAAAAIFLLVSMVGPAWMFSPAHPDTGTPDANLSFSDLGAATAQSPSAIQAAYFGWLGWALVILVIVVSAAAVLLPRRLLSAAELLTGIAALLITALALKGPLSWGGFVQAVPTLRIGGYLMIVGLLVVIIHGAVSDYVSRAS